MKVIAKELKKRKRKLLLGRDPTRSAVGKMLKGTKGAHRRQGKQFQSPVNTRVRLGKPLGMSRTSEEKIGFTQKPLMGRGRGPPS